MSALRGPLDGVASLEDEAIPVLPGNQDEMATRGHWVWMASLDFQVPKGKRVHQETSAPGETKGKMELLGLQGLLDPLGPGALLATLGKMAPGEHQAQWAPKEKMDTKARWAQLDPQGPRGMMGHQASQDPLDPQGPRASQGAQGLQERMAWTEPQGPRGSPASQAPMEPPGPGVLQASRVSKETQW